MFKLSKYADEILKKIKNDEIGIRPLERKNEILSFYEKEELNDISFSRANVKWGIPLPWDKNQTAYVWADAFLNYLSALTPASDLSSPHSPSPSPERGANVSSPLLYKEGSGVVWPPDVQLMSKDILRVHATIWPAMLLSLGLPLPKKIFTHGFFLFEGMKMSKSLGNVISPEMMIKKYGVDATRYLLLSATTFGHDGDISWIFFNEKYNADLANGIGNLVSRSVTLAAKMENVKIKNQNDNSKFKIKDSWKEYQEYFNDLSLDKIIEIIRHTASLLDNYITTNKPWELIKKKDASTGEVMYNILESLRHIALMVYPFMPETAEKIFTDLGLDPAKEFKKDFKELIKWGGLSADVKIKKEEGLFPRISS
jgi:methionyl-tRNA synthetase